MSLIENYSKEEILQIKELSQSFSDFVKKLGYRSNATKTRDSIKNKLIELGISIDDFGKGTGKITRTESNVFCINSTASQQTLRRWYVKGQYTPYVCSICGQEPKWQGKELTLILDHINGSNHDDRLENLRWVCPNCNQQLETTGGKNPQRKNIAKKYYCIDCGKEISKGSKRCVECFSKIQIKSTSNLPVDRDTLKDLIYNKPFTEIGKIYQVSDNAIRKWCDKFNLPRTKTEIKKYSVDAWSKI